MLELQLPARHDWAVQEKNYGKLVMEPFEPGLALTVGIAYRRALLSAIPGAAPTWVKIENVLHEFSHMPGVTEDTLDIIMNLRTVVFALHVNRPKILRLRAQGTGAVKASDFDKDADVEIRSEEHTSELQSQSNLVCRLLLEKKKHRSTSSSTCPHRLSRFTEYASSTNGHTGRSFRFGPRFGRIASFFTVSARHTPLGSFDLQ